MIQYCRYCTYCFATEGVWCELHEHELSESFAKHTNRCKDFDFNPMDAFAENEHGYTPRKPKQKTSEEGFEQLKLDFEKDIET